MTVLQLKNKRSLTEVNGTVVDPFGDIWHIATHKEDVSMEEMEQRAKSAHGGGE
ncbi:MAG TPA: hypothetical protein VGQ72_01450 [Pyrinomonadaceae bacterium]|jgi:PhnB protein|nr:hypothetical protein [Pyrinomonadaceae bacterium]